MKNEHPAVRTVLQDMENRPLSDTDEGRAGMELTTSLSLARALAVGGLSRLDPGLTTAHIWDPAAGTGFAGLLLVDALQSANIHVRYRGQDINAAAVAASQGRFEDAADAEVALGNTLEYDEFADFRADLVIVDPPWGMDWRKFASAVQARHDSGAFSFGLPQRSDSSWLFISLALEKLRPAAEGGGRVAALINPGSLHTGGGSGAVRERIVEAGLLESVTRLPKGLAPNTSIPLYLLTFTNRVGKGRRAKVKIADLQSQFTTEHRHRSMPVSALGELESGLRMGKAGPRNRTVNVSQFIRRHAVLSRVSGEGHRLSWPITTFTDTAIDDQLLKSRYGPNAGVSVEQSPDEILDLDPSHIFGSDSREILDDMDAKEWPSRRLSSFLARAPEAVQDLPPEDREGQLFVPTTRTGIASTVSTDTESSGRILSIRLDSDLIQPGFLTAWLNSEQGIATQRRAIEASSSGTYPNALRSDPRSLMRWADELIIPMPGYNDQIALASADDQLGSFQAELNSQRASIWDAPESAEEVVSRIGHSFDNSLSAWLDQLPFPIASAIWTAETATSPGEQQRAYLHAWEAMVTFHATVLLSVSRGDPGNSSEVEATIRQTLQEQNLGIERASFGTWVIIIERTSKEIRAAFKSGDDDEIARIQRSFGDLGRSGIERLVSTDLVSKFKEVNVKRNRWLGHSGFTSDEEWRSQVVALVSDLREMREILGNVWTQLLLVRAGRSDRKFDGWVQSAELAVGVRSPFANREFVVGDAMITGELYLIRDGSQSPLHLGHFVQLRSAPSSAQYTSYFYNRTEGSSVRMVSYQYGPESELNDDVEQYREAFGELGRADY